jgi:hypothetical protein
MKAIGPQKDVDKAVIIPVSNSIVVRKRFMFTPKFSAYLLPISIRFKGFTSRDETTMQIMETAAYNGNIVSDTPEKLPIPHWT